MLYIFFFFPLRWVSCTPISSVGHLSICTSQLTFSFLSRFRALASFYFLISFLSSFFLFLEHSSPEIIQQVVVTKITRAFNSQRKIEIGECFWLFSPGLGVKYFWVALEMEMSGYMWGCTSGVEAACVSERASES